MKARVALVGVGNCASALVQGVRLYSESSPEEAVGLAAYEVGNLKPGDVEFACAFDAAETKVGRDLSEAIFARPNNTVKICDVPKLGIEVLKGPAMDGFGKYMKDVVKTVDGSDADVARVLRDSGTDVVVNYLPVGSKNATQFYAQQALKAGAAFVNAIPVFVASDPAWQARFKESGLPVAGDDVMSQIGATVLHKTLVKLCVDRGVKVDETYQLNVGGDTDFLNMLEEARLEDKRISKTSAVKAMSPYDVPTRIGPSDYVPFLENDKVCYVWIKGRYFGNTPVTIDVKLHVVDAYNSAGIMIDAIRATKIALEKGISGPLNSVSAYCFKHPPVQMPYTEAKKAFMDFVDGRLPR